MHTNIFILEQSYLEHPTFDIELEIFVYMTEILAKKPAEIRQLQQVEGPSFRHNFLMFQTHSSFHEEFCL